jgi:hypothetical protein
MYTTDCNYYKITNYNNVQQGYYVWTGCTNIISVTPIDPLQSHYVCAKDLYAQDCGAPLTIAFVGLCPSATPTPTQTPTITPTSVTPTPTPTHTQTPTITPTIPPIVFMYNIWTAGYFEDACNLINVPNPSNVTIYCQKTFSSLVAGDYVYGNSSLTIPPINSNNMISDSATFIQINIYNGQILTVGLCN